MASRRRTPPRTAAVPTKKRTKKQAKKRAAKRGGTKTSRTPRRTSAPAPRVGSSARRRMLEAAFDLFHAKGIHATSVGEILARSRTGKSQFYHYFESKDGLILAVVEEFETLVANGKLPGIERIESLKDLERWFGDVIAFQRATGATRFCPMATIAIGLDDGQDAIRTVVDRVLARSRDLLVRFFEESRRRERLAAKCDPEELADFCYAILQGGLVLSRVRRDVAPFERAVKHAIAYVWSLRT